MAEVFINWGDTNKETITLTGSSAIIHHEYTNSGYTIEMSGRTSQITGMTLSGSNITELSGFSDSRLNINFLDLKDNQISSLPNINNKLKHLYLSDNPFYSGATTGTTTDYDGNVYKYVTIGSQQWLTESLRTTHYADGTPILNITGETSEDLYDSGSLWTNSLTEPYESFSEAEPDINYASSNQYSPVVSNCYKLTTTPTVVPTALYVSIYLQQYNNSKMPRLFVYDENDVEFFNAETINGPNTFMISVTGSTGHFKIMLYNTDGNRLNPYYSYFSTYYSSYYLKFEGINGWSSDSTGAYCWYNNDEATYKVAYGGLYNWFAVNNSHGLAPTGWKVANDKDWFVLASYIGGEDVAGEYLKETGTTHWQSPNIATDKYGFAARSTAYRLKTNFSAFGYGGYWWTAGRHGAYDANGVSMYYSNTSLYRTAQYYPFYYGLGVRCMRDLVSPITGIYSGTTLETLHLNNNSFTSYNTNNFPTTMHNFSADNTGLDSNSVSKILDDMYRNSSSKTGMTISMINTIGLLSGSSQLQKYDMTDYSGSTVKTVGRFQVMVDRRTVGLTQSFYIYIEKPVAPGNINVHLDWGDGTEEYFQFLSGMTFQSLQHFYSSATTFTVNIDAYWEDITTFNIQGSFYDYTPIDFREFAGVKKINAGDGNGNFYGGTLNLFRNNQLEELNISNNKYTTMIYPNDVSHMKRIITNQASGIVYPRTDLMPDLEYVQMRYCGMTGPLYDVASKKITYYDIYYNPSLDAGPIPDLTDCTGLTWIELYSTNRTSNGTTDFTTLSSLTYIDLDSNYGLVGSIPTFDNLNNLTSLNIANTGYQWIGDTNWDTLTGLTSFNLDYNGNLSGTTPTLSASTNLNDIMIRYSKLYGELPDFTKWPNTYSINITNNNSTYAPGSGITGSLPDLSNNTLLHSLNLSDNRLNTGSEINQNGGQGWIYTISLGNSGKTFIGGYFNVFSGTTQPWMTKANNDGTRDTSFNINSEGEGFSYYMNVITEDHNTGKVYVGGQFSQFNGSSQNYFIRLNANGTKDTSFNIGTGFNSVVYTIAVDSSGHTYVGGQFTSYNGTSQYYLTRLDSGGTIDSTFDIGNGFSNTVQEIKIDPITDKIYVCGSFTQYSGQSCYYLVRLNPDATIDNTFDLGPGFNSNVSHIAIDSVGKVYVGGSFTTFSGMTQKYVTKLNSDGTRDMSFDIGDGFTSSYFSINGIQVDSSGHTYVGGQFATFSGTTQRCLIRFNTNGTKDTSFDIGSGFTADYSDGYLYSIALDSNDKLYCAGYFTVYNESPQKLLIRLNSDGTKDTSFKCYEGGTMMDVSFNTGLSSLYLTNCNLDYVHPSISGLTHISTLEMRYNNLTKIPNIHHLTTLNYLDLSWNCIMQPFPDAFSGNTGMASLELGYNQIRGSLPESLINLQNMYSINLTANQMSGSLPVCFASMPNLTTIRFSQNHFTSGLTYLSGRTNIQTLDLYGSNFSGLTMFSLVGFNNLYTLDLQQCHLGGIITLGTSRKQYSFQYNDFVGDIPTIGSAYENEWSYNLNVSFNHLTGYTSMVESQHYAKYLYFDHNELSSTEVNKVLADAAKPAYTYGQLSLNGPLMGTPTGQGLVDLDTLLSTYYWNVTINPLTVGNDGFSTNSNTADVYDIGLYPDGKASVGGLFTNFNNNEQYFLVRLNSDGTKDESFSGQTYYSALNDRVMAVDVDSSGHTYVGGYFSWYSGTSQNYIARFDTGGTLDTSFDIGGGFSGFVFNILVDTDDKIFIGGSFGNYSGGTANNFIKLNSDATKDTSFVTTGGNGQVMDIAKDSNGNIYVGGYFSQFNSYTSRYLAKLDSTGGTDTSYVIDTKINSVVLAIAPDSSGNVYIGGQFTMFNGNFNNYMVKINSGATQDFTFDIGTGFNAYVNAIAIDSSGHTYVGGQFTQLNGISGTTSSNAYLIRLNSDGTKDETFNIGVGLDGYVNKIRIDSNDDLYVAGRFSEYNGKSRNSLVKIHSDGSIDNTYNPSRPLTIVDPVANILIFKYIGGSYTSSSIEVSGVTFTVYSYYNQFTWDYYGSNPHLFNGNPNESITRDINGTNFTITYLSNEYTGAYYHNIKIKKT